MLQSLQVRNFAIIDEIDVEFGAGMTVLTGETGAGKSILVDALALVLGERGGSGIVREGAARAEFTAEFRLDALPAASAWLAEQTLDSDGECLLRRIVSKEGRSRSFINGNPVALQMLKTLGEMLLDIHGQHFHQSLGRAAVQRRLLDFFAGAEELLEQTAGAFGDWQVLAAELDALQSAEHDRASRLDLLSFQCDELASLDLQQDEVVELQAARERILHSSKLAEGVASALQLTYDDDANGAHGAIAAAIGALDSLADIDETLSSPLNLLREAEISLTEAADDLRRYADRVDIDPAERERIEVRLDNMQSLARKHRVEATELPNVRIELERQLDELRNADQRGADLQQQVDAAYKRFVGAANRLSSARKQAAIEFSHAVTQAMADLGMGGGQFEIAVRAQDRPREHGVDNVEYLISANPGQPPLPLARIASGGELSRMSLAIQVIASAGSDIPTMIFDEVDSGVGGGTAEMVGLRLRELSSSRQVLCVTHLPQVASKANVHIQVTKKLSGNNTRTSVTTLSDDARIDELARMLGGVEITDRTRAHAAEMLELAGSS